MSTSLFEGLVRYQDSAWGDYAPADAAQSRAVLSNVMHSADSCGQVLANWRTTDVNAVARVLTQASTWYAVWTSAALPIRVRGDGTSYRLRVRLRAAAGVAGTVDFAVVMFGGTRALGIAGYEALDVGAPYSETASSSSTSHAWLTLGGDGLVHLPTTSIDTTEVSRTTLAEIGGAAVGVRYDVAKVAIFAKREAGSGATTSALVSGLHAAEYIGA